MSFGGMTHVTIRCEMWSATDLEGGLALEKSGRAQRARISTMQKVLAIAFLWLAVGLPAPAQAPPTNVSLVSEDGVAKPGSSELIGIRFQVPEGWHIYWVNPGDAGEPPRVQWLLPAGWAAGPLQWPTPTRLVNAAGVDYGYEGDVMLLTRMRVGSAGGDLTANLSWLVCKNVCVPQKGIAKTAVRVGATAANPTGKETITAAKAKLPKTLPDDWKTNAIVNANEVVLNFRPGVKVERATFFPEDREVIDNSTEQKLSSSSYAAQLRMKKADSAKKIVRLKGVLLVDPGTGSTAYSVDLSVK